MANNKTIDYALVKVEGYSANRKYMYARMYPDGNKISVAVHKSIKTDFLNYLGDKNDNRHAPAGSVVALYNLANIKDTFYLTKWAKTVSKKPQTEDVVVSPITVSPVINVGNGKTQVLARIIDPAPVAVNSLQDLKSTCLNVISSQSTKLNVPGKRGFMVRVGTKDKSGVESACFKAIPNATAEQMIGAYFGGDNNSAPSNAMKSIVAAIQKTESMEHSFVEVVGFTDAPVFNYGNSKNDEKLATTPNFRIKNGTKESPTFSNAALTIDRQDNKILRVTTLPDKNIISNIHGLVGSHDKAAPQNIPFVLPKQFAVTAENEATKKPTNLITIEPYIDSSNKQFNSIIVRVNANAPAEVHSRILSATTTEPRKGAEGYYFNQADRKRVEAALSDLAGTPALYTTTGTKGDERYVFIAGRTNESQFKNQLDELTKTYPLQAFAGGLYGVPEKDSMAVLAAMSDLLKQSATSTLQQEHSAKTTSTPKASKAPKPRKPTYIEWLNAKYRQNPQAIAQEFDAEIKAEAEKAGIDWDNSKDNIIWPSLNASANNIGTTANVKPEKPADNGSCYISTIFSSWKTTKGNEQYGIVVTFANLNKDKNERWSYSSHLDTYNNYSQEVWGAQEKDFKQKPQPTAEELAHEQRMLAEEAKRKVNAKVAKADANKNESFNNYSSLPSFAGDHKGLAQKQLPDFPRWVNAKAYTIYGNPSNKAFAYAAYDIHERFVGYQFIPEEKLLINKDKPEKKKSWTNKMYNAGFQKDDVRTSLPLGSHHTIGEINPNSPHVIYYTEGWANAGSDYALTNEPNVICFDQSNMKKVIGLMVKKHPNHIHVHVSDNDLHSSQKGNVGVMAALENAYNFGSKVVIPDVKAIDGYIENKYTDTSDLFTNNHREALASQLAAPQDLSDIVLNHILRIQYTKESQLNQHISLLAQVCDKVGVNQDDTLAIINEALTARVAEYAPVEPNYRHAYMQGFTAEALANIQTANSNEFKKLEFDIIEDTATANDTRQVSEEPLQPSSDATMWPVTVKAIQNPSPIAGNKSNTITEITTGNGEYTSTIERKLLDLGVQYTYNAQAGKFYAPYKFINLINSGLSDLTGAQKLYAGRSRNGQPSTVVVRGDFSSQANKEEVEAILKPLGISYNNSEMGYVITNPNTYVFVKEALLDSFSKANPNIDTVMGLQLDEPQVQLSNILDKVSFSLGLEKKDLAKQQLKLNQHNPKLGGLESPLIAGVYYQAEHKVKSSELANVLSPAERVYAQQRTLQTLLKSLYISQPSLQRLYSDDVDNAIAILNEQMPPAVSPAIPEEHRAAKKHEADITLEPYSGAASVKVEQLDTVEDETLSVDMQTESAIIEAIPEVESDAEALNTPEEAEALLNELNQLKPSDDGLGGGEVESDPTLQQQLAVFQDIVSDIAEHDYSLKEDRKPTPVVEFSTVTAPTIHDINEQEIAAVEINSVEVKALEIPHKTDVEVRLGNLVDFVQTYLNNEYESTEIMDSLREPGSPYYDVELGFQVEKLRNDIKQVQNTSFADQFNIKSRMSPFSFVAAIENASVENRLAQLDLFIDKILEKNPNFDYTRIARAARNGSHLGVTHPYMTEDGVYNKGLLKSDLLYIGGFQDITTLTGYFKYKQEALNNDIAAEFHDETELSTKQLSSASIMPPPPSLKNTQSVTVEQDISEQTIVLDTVDQPEAIKEPAITIESSETDIINNDIATPVANAKTITINNENSTYDELYQLAIKCAQEQMNYDEFYESVFTSDGVYYEDNPFVVNDKLAKNEVVNALLPNGFKSPKGFYESAFIDAQGKTQSAVELSRVSGVAPESVDSTSGIGSQFDVIATLTNNKKAPSLDVALEITKQSFKSWYNNGLGDAVIPLNDIFTENLNATTAAELNERYQPNDIKLLADVSGVPVNNDNVVEAAENVLAQWKVQQELAGLSADDFIELPMEECSRIAAALGVSNSPSKADLARNVYKKSEDLKQLTNLRIAQYSYVLSAITIEQERGKLPAFVYRQLNSLLSEEANYKPVVLDRLNKIETANLHNAVSIAKDYIDQLSDKDRHAALLVEVPTTPEMVGVDNADKIGLGTFKYIVTEGNARTINKPPHMTGFAVYGENQILAPSAFSLTAMKAGNIQPVSNNAIIETLSPAQDLFEKQGYVSFTTEKGMHGVIHQDKKRYTLRLVKENGLSAEAYNETSFNKAFERALDFFPVSSIEITDGFSAKLAQDKDDTRNSLNSLNDVLLPQSVNGGSDESSSKDTALDLLAKANELEYTLSSNYDDVILQAVSLVDELKENHSRYMFEEVIGIEFDKPKNHTALLEHAVSLSNETKDADEEVNETPDNELSSLLDELNAGALRDLNTRLTLEEDALTFRDVYEASMQVDAEKEKENLRDLSTLVNSDVAPEVTDIEPGTNIVTDDEKAIIENQDATTAQDDVAVMSDIDHSTLATSKNPIAITENTLVTYQVGDTYKFGYIFAPENELMISQYTLQDEHEKLLKSHPELFIEFKGSQTPVFALNYSDYLDAVKENKRTGNAKIDRILKNTNNLPALSVKDMRLLGELIGVIPKSKSLILAKDIIPSVNDYFKVNRLSMLPEELLSDEDKAFVNVYFSDENASANLAELSKELTMGTSERIASLAYAMGVEDARNAGLNINLVTHANNTTTHTPLNDVDNVNAINKSDLLNIGELPAEVANAKFREERPLNKLARSMAESYDTATLDLPAEVGITYNVGQQVYAVHNGKLVLATLTSDILDGDTHTKLNYIDKEGFDISFSENVNYLSIDTDTANEAGYLVEEYFKITDGTPISSIESPFHTDDDELGAVSLHSRLLANKLVDELMFEVSKQANVPKGYKLLVTQGKYHITLHNREQEAEQYNALGMFKDINELNKAILIAKRDILGAKNNDNTNTLRSESTESPETVLPEPTQEPTKDEHTGSVHDGKANGAERNGGPDNEEAIRATPVEQQLHREHDSAGVDQSGSPISSEANRISTNGIKLNPNVNYTYDEETIRDISISKSEEQTYEINLEAIKLAKQLTAEKRTATTEEKNTLAKYRGWGGLSKILDPAYITHASKRAELNQLLSPAEYESVKRSTLSAFYTNPAIIAPVWSGLERMGLKGGVGLDPAFGIGNFASAMPYDLTDNVTLVAKEIDPLTAEIAKHIHGPLIRNEGYEKAKIPQNTFDFAVGNIPFGDFKVHDKNHRDLAKHLIHDYFILKTIDKVKPGGFVSFITSSGTLDKKSSDVREQISKQADLIAAIRLPTDAFNDNARTQVNSDILFFQKRLPNTEPNNTDWVDIGIAKVPTSIHGGYEEDVEVNNYFVKNQGMIIGNQHITSTRFGGRTYRTVLNGDLSTALNEIVQKLPQDIHFDYEPALKEDDNREVLSELTSGKRLGSYHLDSDGDVAIVVEKFELLPEEDELVSTQALEKVTLKPAQVERMKKLIELRDTTKSHIQTMLTTDGDAKFNESLEKLVKQYDEFNKTFGPLNKQVNKRLFKGDPDAALLLGLERWDKKEKTAEKADIFTERTLMPRKEFTHVDDVEDAVIISLSEKGHVDPNYIENLTSKSWPNIVVELGDSIFLNPESQVWEHASTYLSGHVRDKLELAQHAASSDDMFKHNVKSLGEVIPTDIPYYEIRAKLGSSWIPDTDVRDFIKYIIKGEDEPCTSHEAEKLYKVSKVRGNWEIAISSYEVSVNSGRTKSEFGTEEWPADKLISAIINSKSVTVKGKDSEGRSFIIADKTAEATAKADLIKETFKQWLWDKPGRAERLEASYNRAVNGFVEPRFDGSKIEIEGLSSTLKGKEFKPRQKQLNAIQRYLVDGRALFLHDVGVGKSFALLGSIIKGKQVGKHSKAILAVPNAVFPQMQDLALGHFPNAKVLMVDAKSLNKENREATLAQVTTNSWDIVIVSHSIAERISVPDEFKLDLIDQEMSEVEAAIDSLSDAGFHGGLSVKSHQKKLENERKKIMDRIDSEEVYNTVNIEEMGVDALFIDEADEFVNLNKITNMGHVAGVAVTESKKARAIYYLTNYLHHKNGNTGIVLATGTDIRNNIGDQFTLLRYLAPDILMEQNIDMYDDFIGTFGEITTKFEIAPEGSGFIEKTRLSKFYNLPELSMLYRQVADIVNAEDANIKRPDITEVQVSSDPSEELNLYMQVLTERAQSIRNGGNSTDNLLAITNDGRKAALDIRFLHPKLPDHPDSKVNKCVANVLHEYHQNKALNPSQIIFSDIGVPNGDGRFDLYNDIKVKLAAGGIDEDKVVFARDFKTDAQKQELQDKMNSGEIAVTIGTTENMGVGKNVQERLAAIHDLSIPWRVRDLEQRGGRIERFGNIFENATRYKYTTKDSFDLFIWNKLKQKALFAAQTKRTPRDAAREFDEDVNLSYSEIMAANTGNPLIEESITLESEVDRLGMLERGHHRAKSSRMFEIGQLKDRIDELKEVSSHHSDLLTLIDDGKTRLLGKPLESFEGDFQSVAKVVNKAISDAKKQKKPVNKLEVGDISGHKLFVETTSVTKKLSLVIEGNGQRYEINDHHFVGSLMKSLEELKANSENRVERIKSQITFNENKIQSIESVNNNPFEFGEKLIECKQRLVEVQREIAEEAEKSDKTTIENPQDDWNDLLLELNRRTFNDAINECEKRKDDNLDTILLH